MTAMRGVFVATGTYSRTYIRREHIAAVMLCIDPCYPSIAVTLASGAQPIIIHVGDGAAAVEAARSMYNSLVNVSEDVEWAQTDKGAWSRRH